MALLALALTAAGGGIVVPIVGRPHAGQLQIAQSPLPKNVCMAVQRRPSAAEKVKELPPQLAEWGCDANLWNQLRNQGRKNLCQEDAAWHRQGRGGGRVGGCASYGEKALDKHGERQWSSKPKLVALPPDGFSWGETL